MSHSLAARSGKKSLNNLNTLFASPRGGAVSGDYAFAALKRLGDDKAEVLRKRWENENVAPFPGPFLLLSGKGRLDAQFDILKPRHGLFQNLYAL